MHASYRYQLPLLSSGTGLVSKIHARGHILSCHFYGDSVLSGESSQRSTVWKSTWETIRGCTFSLSWRFSTAVQISYYFSVPVSWHGWNFSGAFVCCKKQIFKKLTMHWRIWELLFLPNSFFHTTYSDHGFFFPIPSQILHINPTPCFLSIYKKLNKSQENYKK